MLSIDTDIKFGIGYKESKNLNLDIINGCYCFNIKWDDKEVEQVLSPSDTKALSLMLIKAKERIYGW